MERRLTVTTEYHDVPTSTIFCDTAFNCRSPFPPQSCLDLSQSIARHGLQFPVVVQPREDVEEGIPSGYKYRLLVGHRRFTAVTQLLQLDTIACEVRTGLTSQEAHILNLMENLERKSLSIIDEAKGLHSIFPEPVPVREMARTVSKSREWCRIRYELLTLPDKVQQVCGAGHLAASDIAIILATDKARQVSMCDNLLKAKERGESARRRIRNYSKTRRTRSRTEIEEMIARLMVDEIEPSPYRALAWASGEISDDDLLENIDE
jgi:ParB/RepB/Spo0J family partition protein